MKFTYNWLKRHLETPEMPEEISTALTSLGLEVEGVHNPAEALKAFRIAEILETTPHPDADRLKVCMVNTGQGGPLQVVCGGPNARPGIKVVLAEPGMVIPSNGMTMKLSKIRGVESHGMLCSTVELGLGSESDGILELEADAPVGGKLVDYLSLDDPIYEVGLTPNRGDCLGVRGIARDLAAADMGTLKPVETPSTKGAFESPLTVTAGALVPYACPHFMGRYIKGVKNGESPLWMQHYLKAAGIEPISTLVDITNFLMLDLNRPLHVFDADTLKGGLELRMAHAGESFEALNNKTYTLTPEMTVVADQEGVVALGGIIGGLHSGCTAETTNVFLEAAYFDPKRTAQTGRALNLTTDARYRFERGIDPLSARQGIDAATDLILSLCGGTASQVLEVGVPPFESSSIALSHGFVKHVLGYEIPMGTMTQILERLGCTVDTLSIGELMVTPPSWRPDLSIPVDLVEEVARVYGYEHMPALPLPCHRPALPVVTPAQQKRSQLRHMLASRGLHELVTWSMVSKQDFEMFGGEGEALAIRNPISEGLAWMRPSLLPNLLRTIQYNQDRGQGEVGLFEIGNQYAGTDPEAHQMMVASMRSGMTHEGHWQDKPRSVTVYDAKADLLAALGLYGVTADNVQIVQEDVPAWFHPGRAAFVRQGPKRVLGVFGEIHPRIQRQFGIRGRVVAMTLNLDLLPVKAGTVAPFEIPKQLKVTRDFSFLVRHEQKAQELVQAISKVDRAHIASVTVFDVYQGSGVPEGQKALSIRVALQPKDRSFTDDEIQSLYQRIIQAAQKNCGAEFRE